MEKYTEIKDFTKGNLTAHLIKFTIPVLLSHLMMVFLNTVDMVVVGQRLGEAGTSAVSIGGSVAMFLNAFIGGFSSAVQVIIAMLTGKNKTTVVLPLDLETGFGLVKKIIDIMLLITQHISLVFLLREPS